MTQKLIKLADLHATTCFLNSLLREWNDFVIYRSENNLFVLIQVSDNEHIKIPLLSYSMLGRHEYSGKFYLKTDNKNTEINFDDFVERICMKLETINNTSLAQFKANVLSSRDNIYQALQVHTINNDEKYSFKNAEQALIIGHNFHPTPKSRDTLSKNELHTYAPEFKGEFPLQWLLVDKAILLHVQAKNSDDKNWLATLFNQDIPNNNLEIPNNMLPIPMHPWQWQHLQKDPVITEYLQKNQIIPLDHSSLKWSATSSLRTVYRDNCSYMLKFSMSLRLTNSVRVLQSSEVARGILLHDVLASDKGKQFCNEFPNFHIITEPAYLGLMDKQGKVMENTMLVCRQNPFNGDNAENKFMLASLIQDDPYGGINLLLQIIQNSSVNALSMHERLKKWFNDYLQVAIQPLLIAYAKYGIIMEGHQQNIVLSLKDGFPVAAYFRDCQDHAYSEHGYQLFSDSVTTNSVADKKIGCHYFIYQVMLNSTFNVITTLAKSQHIQEQELLYDLRELLITIKKQDVLDHYCLDLLLSSKTLLHKCNFQFALTRINDNQLPCNPLDLYTPVTNLISMKSKQSTILYHRYLTTIQKAITFRLIDLAKDLEQFITWQQNPRIAKYWQLDKSRNEAKDYLEKTLAEPHHQAVIIEINHEPIGYTEFYWVAHDAIAEHYDHYNTDRGFHLLIGEDSFLGVENTKSVFQAIMHYLYLTDNRTQRIIVEPDKHNHRFIKYMQIIPGWRLIKEADLPDKKAVIFMAHRNDFMLENVS